MSADDDTARFETFSQRMAAFEAANGVAGRLRRYAQGRLRHFASRQIVTAAGGLGLLVTVGPALALSAMALALLGEAVDALVLRHVLRRLEAGDGPQPLVRLATFSAVVQALTIAACIVLAWASASPGDSSFFAFAFLTGAALNAGLVLPFSPEAARARLWIYGLTTGLLLAGEWVRAGGFEPRLVYDGLGVLVMGFMIHTFLRFVSGHHARHVSRERALLESQEELEHATARLASREREARLLALVARHARDSIMITEADGRIAWVNDAFTAITGYSREEAIGKHPAALLNGPETDPALLHEIARCLERGEPFRGELVNYTRDGRKIWIDSHLVPVRRESGVGDIVIAVERDVTQAREARQKLAEALRQARKADRAKSEFLATMSHEIRTPMNGIIGMAEMLEQTTLDADQRLYCETIHSSARALLTIINDILDFSRLQAGKMEIHPEPCDLHRCLTQPVELMRGIARGKGIGLTLEIGPEVPRRAVTDEGRLRQILLNLLGNAVKFTEKGGVTVRCSCPAPGRLAVAVEDTGIGIAPDKLDTIFERFTQADGSITRRFGGTGLGLAISQLLAQMLDGRITVTSRLGEGSVFTLEIALEAVADAAAGDDATAGEPVAGGPSGAADDRTVKPLRYGEDAAPGSMTPVSTPMEARAPAEKGPAARSTDAKGTDAISKAAKTPTTKAPTEKAPTEKAPTEKAPTTKAPTAKAPTVEAPTAEAATTGGQAANGPVAKGPVAKGQAAKDPVANGPASRTGGEVAGGAAEAREEVTGPPAAGPGSATRRLRVLVAEDNGTNRLLLERFLHDQPLDLEFAVDGVEAVAKALEWTPDVILMDVSMPGMDGLEATRAIRAVENLPQPRIIALTANTFEDDRRACLQAGMDHFLGKPLRRAELLAALGRAGLRHAAE